MVTVTVRPVRLVRATDGDGARAEPQARVSPAPRSQVRMVIASGEVTWAIEMLARSGKIGWFDIGLETVELVCPDIVVTQKTAVAHVGDRGRVQHRRVDRADLQLDHAGVAEFLGQRDLLPVKARHAHVDRDQPIGMFLGRENAGDGLEGEQLAAGLGRQRLHDAAHAVAAGLRHRAVGVDDLDVVLGARRPAIVDRHDLVELRRRIGGERHRRGRRDAIRAAAHVGDDDVVAEPVHLGEGGCAGHEARVSAVFRRYMAERTANYQYGNCRRSAVFSLWRRGRAPPKGRG